MIHFQFGELHLEAVGKRTYHRGESGLMIEIAAGKIARWYQCLRPVTVVAQ